MGILMGDSARESELTPCTEPWDAPVFRGYGEEVAAMETSDQYGRTEARENRVCGVQCSWWGDQDEG